MNSIFQKSAISFLWCLLFVVSSCPAEARRPSLNVGGLVQSPMNLTLSDLQQFSRLTIPANLDTASKGNRTLSYSAVSLRTLLEIAKTQEPIQELVISVKNDRGEQMVLTGRELTPETRHRVYIAVSVNARDTSVREDLPALVLADGNGFRLSIRGITFVEAVSMAQIKADELNSRKISLPAVLAGNLTQTESVQGCQLLSALNRISVHPERTDILRITARNGNAIVSCWELMSASGPVVVSRKKQEGVEASYDLLLAAEGNGVRRLENLESIEIISLKQKGMMYVVGVGCGDPNLLTSEAVSIMGKADAFVSKEDYLKTLGGYIAGKPVLFDPFMQLARYQKAKNPGLTDAEAEKTANAVYAENIQMLRRALREGKIVALLEPGDPTLYGGWRNWLSGYIPEDQLKVIPGMSSFSVANALLGEYDVTGKSVIIAEPEELKASEPLMQAAAQGGHLLVVFMGLNRINSLVPMLGRYFEPDTPLIIAYNAGIAGKERRVQTILSKAIEAAAREKENFLGLIYIGRGLKEYSNKSNP